MSHHAWPGCHFSYSFLHLFFTFLIPLYFPSGHFSLTFISYFFEVISELLTLLCCPHIPSPFSNSITGSFLSSL
jgi:hypothetical protein